MADSSDRAVYVLRGPSQVELACAYISRPDSLNKMVVIRPQVRSLEQNAHFHALCYDLERSRLPWMGQPRSLEQWKVLLVSAHAVATGGRADILTGLEGEIVSLREATSEMTVGRLSSLIEYTLAFCLQSGVDPEHYMRKYGRPPAR